jgi:large conductance mechanosensitive channel
MRKEFREFALKGNLVDVAVGLILGAAFGAVVKSLVDELIMPPIGLLLGGVDFSNLYVVLREGAAPGPYPSLVAAREAGAVVLGWGAFVNVALTFLITAFAVFMLVKGMNAARRKQTAEAEATPEPELTTDQALLAEIRDLLRARPGA